MSGRHPYSELTKHFTEEDRRLVAIGTERLRVKAQIAESIGEDLLLKNDDLSDLLIEAELISPTKTCFTPSRSRFMQSPDCPGFHQ